MGLFIVVILPAQGGLKRIHFDSGGLTTAPLHFKRSAFSITRATTHKNRVNHVTFNRATGHGEPMVCSTLCCKCFKRPHRKSYPLKKFRHQ